MRRTLLLLAKAVRRSERHVSREEFLWSPPAAPPPRRARALDGQIVPPRDQSIRVRSGLGAPWADPSPAVRLHLHVAPGAVHDDAQS
jgi:hypothetical protein